MRFGKFGMTLDEMIGAALAILGLVLVLAMKLGGAKEGFWVSYVDGSLFIGWLLLFAGAVWLGLGAVVARTSFFDSDRGLSADRFGPAMAAIVVAIVIVLAFVIPRLPATDDGMLPGDPKARELVLSQERHFRQYVAAAVICAGLAVGLIPTIRFLRK